MCQVSENWFSDAKFDRPLLGRLPLKQSQAKLILSVVINLKALTGFQVLGSTVVFEN